MRPQILITVLVAAILGALASFGVYQAAQPSAYKANGSIYTYGSSN